MFKNKACMYLRLSKDDGIHSESNSITNQRELIQSYARKNELEIVKEYTDDGYSGTNYDRPALKNMLEEIGKNDRAFNVIIVKDLSRFGRDYIGAGKYIQKIFPQFHIRFISINDNYDSQHADMSDTNLILPIRNFINDSYARDISNKVKSSQKMKREKGEYIGSFAPYGYKKSEENKNKLIVDENVRDIIKSIFDMKLKVKGPVRGAGKINQGSENPRRQPGAVHNPAQGFEIGPETHEAESGNGIFSAEFRQLGREEFFQPVPGLGGVDAVPLVCVHDVLCFRMFPVRFKTGTRSRLPPRGYAPRGGPSGAFGPAVRHEGNPFRRQEEAPRS